MGKIIDEMKRYLTDIGWGFNEVEGKDAVRLKFQGSDSVWGIYVHVREEAGQCLFYSVPLFTVPEDRRTDVALFITRVNFGLLVGNFEMDIDDGEVRYKTSLDINGASEIFPYLAPIVNHNVVTMDRYHDGFETVIEGRETALKAVERCDQK